MGRGGPLKGINIPIGADVTGLDTALADVNKRARDTQIELKQVEKLLKLDPKNTELVAQKQALLAKSAATTREKLQQLKSAQAEVNRQFKAGEIGEKEYRAFNREVAKTEGELKKAGVAGKTTGQKIVDGAKGIYEQYKIGAAAIAGVAYVMWDLVKTSAAASATSSRSTMDIRVSTG